MKSVSCSMYIFVFLEYTNPFATPGGTADGIRILQEDEDVHGAAHGLHEQARLRGGARLRRAARSGADEMADPARHGGAQGQGARARSLESLPPRERAGGGADQSRVRAALRDHGALAHRA